MRRLVAWCLVVALSGLATSCASLRPKYSLGVDLQVGIKVPALGRRLTFDGIFLRYFPSSVTLRPGDTVRFNLRDSGEPHTATFGTLVDDAVAAMERAGEDATLYELEDLPQMRKLPKPFTRVEPNGALNVNRAATDRCFLEAEDPPVTPDGDSAVCRSDDRPEFNGRQTFYNAGRVSAGETFEMTLDDTIAKGTYNFMCLIHPSVMRGSIDIVGPDEYRPRPIDPKRRAEGVRNKPGEEADAVRRLRGAANLAGAATAVNAVAGVPATQDVGDYLATFGPPDYKIDVGKPLTWTMYGLHSITFNKPDNFGREVYSERDGRDIVNERAWAPADSPSPPADGAIAKRDRKGESFEIDAGTWDGSGYHSSGVIFSRTPGAVKYSLTFSRSGTYQYVCLVHRTMKGKVVVNQRRSRG